MMRCLVVLMPLAAGCAATLVEGTMPNPARRTDNVSSTQTWEIGPHKENHQYELTLGDWQQASLGLTVKISEVDRCADPKGYTYTLVDDHAVHTSFVAAGEPTSTTQPGSAGKTLTVSRLTGAFAATVVPDTHFLTVEMRPLKGVACPSIDFRWTFQ